jgi:hypothetical protein
VSDLPAYAYVFAPNQTYTVHAMNLVTRKWLHRDVQGVLSPTVSVPLNQAATFSCSWSAIRSDLLSSPGVPLLQTWQTGIFVEQAGRIKFGGIVTNSTQVGDSWALTATGYMGYPNGVPYTGTYSATKTSAFIVVDEMLRYLQNVEGSPLFLNVHWPTAVTPPLLGTTTQPVTSTVTNPSTHAVTTKTTQQVVPFTLDWWNQTDIGSEISAIQTEAVFDWLEVHAWTDSQKTAIDHAVNIYYPRLGVKQTGLVFIEGENIQGAPQVTQDGTNFANKVFPIGAGSGSAALHGGSITANDGRLGRPVQYVDQTITTQARLTAIGRKILASKQNMDTISSFTIVDHPNAPFGSFGIGDDIFAVCTSGWRAGFSGWMRITQMDQNLSAGTMTLTTARSDSFSYLAESGQAGTL